jgi:hypothetical protein
MDALPFRRCAHMPVDPLLPEATRERLRLACASLDLAETTGSAFAMSQALAEVARCHRELRDPETAEVHLEAAVRWARLSGSTDHLSDLLCELADAAAHVALDEGPFAAEVSVRRAARERARDRAFEVSQLAGRISDPTCEAGLLLRVGEVLERCGDHADARQMQLRALSRMGGLAPRDASRLSGFGRLADH